MAEVFVQGDRQDSRFNADWAVSISTETDRRNRPRARWVEAGLYGKTGGGYVLHIVNYSRVWHLPAGAAHVRKPKTIAGSELPDGAVYCGAMPVRPDRGHCPVYWADGGSRVTDPFRLREMPVPPDVVTELPQRKITECADYASLITEMSTFRKRGATSVSMSEPMAALLEKAAGYDEAFWGRPVVSL